MILSLLPCDIKPRMEGGVPKYSPCSVVDSRCGHAPPCQGL